MAWTELSLASEITSSNVMVWARLLTHTRAKGKIDRKNVLYFMTLSG